MSLIMLKYGFYGILLLIMIIFVLKQRKKD